ncbi:MAG: hypothetical protein H7210_11470 [Pyrinomonadaceae bacterium]|nr:hypothetical protein [Phycisphaerales bacterium]
MQSKSDRIRVRNHERHECALPVRLLVDPAFADLVPLSKKVRGPDGAIPAVLVDCGLGGLGIESGCLIPKGCQVRIRLVLDTSAPGASHAEFTTRVQRVIMKGTDPKYFLGTVFVGDRSLGESSLQDESLQKLIQFISPTSANGSSQRA